MRMLGLWVELSGEENQEENGQKKAKGGTNDAHSREHDHESRPSQYRGRVGAVLGLDRLLRLVVESSFRRGRTRGCRRLGHGTGRFEQRLPLAVDFISPEPEELCNEFPSEGPQTGSPERANVLVVAELSDPRSPVKRSE